MRCRMWLFLTALAGVAVTAQDRPASQNNTFRSRVDLVSVTATVVDHEGKLVTGLPKEAFELYEDGDRQTVTQFTNERVPISVAVLLDASDSMYGQRLLDARAAVERFLFELLDPADEFCVVAFNHQPRLLTQWTRSQDVIRQALSGLVPFGSTSMYDAVIATLPLMETRSRERAALLIISDGADTASDAAMHDVRSALLRSDSFAYAIGIDPPARRAINTSVNVAALTDITNGSGGRTELVHDTADLTAATARIADELNKQYVLAYASSRAQDGRYHSIRVHAVDPGYRVRARNGYVGLPRGGPKPPDRGDRTQP
jgi:Ca-activated chloride channel family protein